MADQVDADVGLALIVHVSVGILLVAAGHELHRIVPEGIVRIGRLQGGKLPIQGA